MPDEDSGRDEEMELVEGKRGSSNSVELIASTVGTVGKVDCSERGA